MDEETKKNQPNSDSHKSGSHSGHMWMMVICCALPLLSLLGFGALETSFSFTEILLLAGIGFGVFYFIRSRKRRHHQPEPAVISKEENKDDKVALHETRHEQLPSTPEIPTNDRTGRVTE